MVDQTTRGHQFLKKNFGAENSRPIFLDQIFNADSMKTDRFTNIASGHAYTEGWKHGCFSRRRHGHPAWHVAD
jgi:hypothetical protein